MKILCIDLQYLMIENNIYNLQKNLKNNVIIIITFLENKHRVKKEKYLIDIEDDNIQVKYLEEMDKLVLQIQDLPITEVKESMLNRLINRIKKFLKS